MSSLKVRQTKTKLKTLFEQHLDLRDIASADSDRETKILSRCLAAYAIYREAGCSAEEASSAVWDGADDNGIDGAFFDATENCVILVQSKWIHAGSGEPEAKDLRTFVTGVTSIIEQEDEGFSGRLKLRLAHVQRALLEVGTTIKLIVVSTGKSTLSTHGKRVMEKIVSTLNGDDAAGMASYEVQGLDSIYTALASGTQGGSINIDATIYEWSFFQIRMQHISV